MAPRPVKQRNLSSQNQKYTEHIHLIFMGQVRYKLHLRAQIQVFYWSGSPNSGHLTGFGSKISGQKHQKRVLGGQLKIVFLLYFFHKTSFYNNFLFRLPKIPISIHRDQHQNVDRSSLSCILVEFDFKQDQSSIAGPLVKTSCKKI